MVQRTVRKSLLAVLCALIVTGCGGQKRPVDPYQTVTLRQATRGKVASIGFRYKFVSPEIEALNRNLGLIREADVLEFIGARGLEDKLADKTNGSFALGVVKEFSPYVHFRVERIYTDTDTTFLTPGIVVYPSVVDAARFNAQGFEPKNIDDIDYNRTDVIRGLENKRIAVRARITRETDKTGSFYVLHGRNAKFRVADTPDGTGLVLKVLADKGLPFDGGIVMARTEEFAARMATQTVGTVEILFVKYGSRVVSG